MDKEPKNLAKSSSQKVLFGVAGGTAEFFGLDVILVRVLFIVLTFVTGGLFALVYLAGAIIMPESTKPAEAISAQPTALASDGNQNNPIGGLVLITLGAILLLENFYDLADYSKLWPLIFVALGIGLLMPRKTL